jgi:phage tail-like protein
MAGLDPAIHVFSTVGEVIKTWMPGTRPGMTKGCHRLTAPATSSKLPAARLQPFIEGQGIMAEFTVNPTRFDPYKNFKFRVKWDGKYVAAVSKVGSLKRTTEVVEHREGGDPSTAHKSPGRTKYEAITLERGLTQDLAFHDWAGLVWNFGAALGSEVSLANFRKDIYLEMYNEAGQLVIAYKIYRCWVSEYQALPDLDANANAIAIEHIKLENEGWERDASVTEPKEPTLSSVNT